MEAVDHANARGDKNTTHDQCADDSPEKNAVLLLFGNGKILEDHQEDEKVVDAQRQFKNIAGEEFQAALAILPDIEPAGEEQGQRHIHGAPAQGFTKAHHVAGTVKDLQVEHQHAEREQIEENPEIEQADGLGCLRITTAYWSHAKSDAR